MEKYKYQFLNNRRLVDTVEAETLEEAMKKAGVEQYVVRYEFPFMAVITPVKNQMISLGVRWERVG